MMFSFNIVVTGIANLVFTFVAIHTVDRLGRRALMMIGAGGSRYLSHFGNLLFLSGKRMVYGCSCSYGYWLA